MTHQELLAKIDNNIDFCMKMHAPQLASYSVALRAVVELHKPANDGFNWYPTFCSKCSSKTVFSPYPCPTIQAIEKELQ